MSTVDHQPRNQAVPCRLCRRDTWDLWAICERCTDRAIELGLHPARPAA